jgi:hypothetical protein
MTDIYVVCKKQTPILYTIDPDYARKMLPGVVFFDGDTHPGETSVCCGESAETGVSVWRTEVDREIDGHSQLWVAVSEDGELLGAEVEVADLVEQMRECIEMDILSSMHALSGPSNET